MMIYYKYLLKCIGVTVITFTVTVHSILVFYSRLSITSIDLILRIIILFNNHCFIVSICHWRGLMQYTIQ